MKSSMQKFLSSCLLILFSAFTVATVTPSSASAFDGRTDCPSFLGLTSWDCGVSITDQSSLKTGIWQIVANVASDITIVAAYLVLGYVIYGGYLYIFSGGDPNKVLTAKKTLTHAFIGLAITMSASVIMGAIRIALVAGSGDIGDCLSDGGCVDPNTMVENLISWVIGICGVVAAIFLVYGGVGYMTASGDAGKLRKAKDTIIYALIGLAIVALAEVITSFVSGLIRDANSTTTNNNQVSITKIISKESLE